MLNGISEKIIIGHLAPMGTGFFDVVLEMKTINEHAQIRIGDDLMQEGNLTPMMEE